MPKYAVTQSRNTSGACLVPVVPASFLTILGIKGAWHCWRINPRRAKGKRLELSFGNLANYEP